MQRSVLTAMLAAAQRRFTEIDALSAQVCGLVVLPVVVISTHYLVCCFGLFLLLYSEFRIGAANWFVGYERVVFECI